MKEQQDPYKFIEQCLMLLLVLLVLSYNFYLVKNTSYYEVAPDLFFQNTSINGVDIVLNTGYVNKTSYPVISESEWALIKSDLGERTRPVNIILVVGLLVYLYLVKDRIKDNVVRFRNKMR